MLQNPVEQSVVKDKMSDKYTHTLRCMHFFQYSHALKALWVGVIDLPVSRDAPSWFCKL